MCSVHTSGEEGGRGSDKEGVKDAIGGRLEKKWVLLLLHFVLGCVHVHGDW